MVNGIGIIYFSLQIRVHDKIIKGKIIFKKKIEPIK